MISLGLIKNLKLLHTFLSAAPLSNFSNIDNFSSEIISGMLGIKPGAASFGSKYANN